MPSVMAAATALQMRYETATPAEALAGGEVLAVIEHGSQSGRADAEDPRLLRVALEPLGSGPATCEVWRGIDAVRSGREGALSWSTDGEHLFFAIELAEEAHGGLAAATEAAYRQFTRFVRASATPHLLRLWNYIDAINEGPGDQERYRLFCSGRARGMDAWSWAQIPAACAIGGHGGQRRLQIYGLAARQPGNALENPRQVSAWRYPRRYGPNPPVFARAMLDADGRLLISGTAAVVGHASRHEADLAAQLGETLANLDAVVAAAGMGGRGRRNACFKAYVREPRDAPQVAAALRPWLGGEDQLLLLGGDICRRELLVEVEGVCSAA